jgi:hypothetical protein
MCTSISFFCSAKILIFSQFILLYSFSSCYCFHYISYLFCLKDLKLMCTFLFLIDTFWNNEMFRNSLFRCQMSQGQKTTSWLEMWRYEEKVAFKIFFSKRFCLCSSVKIESDENQTRTCAISTKCDILLRNLKNWSTKLQ